MFERFSGELHQVLFKSRSLAEEYPTGSITVEHLLLAAITTSSRISEYTSLHGRNVDEMVAELQRLLTSRSQSLQNENVSMGTDAKEAIRIAGDLGWERLPAKVSVWHLLIGILSQKDSAAAAVLSAYGLSMAELESLAAQSE